MKEIIGGENPFPHPFPEQGWEGGPLHGVALERTPRGKGKGALICLSLSLLSEIQTERKTVI